jgi:hypothetical protein
MTIKKQKKLKKFLVLKCWMFSLEDRRLFLYLGRPLWWPRNRLINCNLKKDFFKAVTCYSFDHQTLVPDPDPDSH